MSEMTVAIQRTMFSRKVCGSRVRNIWCVLGGGGVCGVSIGGKHAAERVRRQVQQRGQRGEREEDAGSRHLPRESL